MFSSDLPPLGGSVTRIPRSLRDILPMWEHSRDDHPMICLWSNVGMIRRPACCCATDVNVACLLISTIGCLYVLNCPYTSYSWLLHELYLIVSLFLERVTCTPDTSHRSVIYLHVPTYTDKLALYPVFLRHICFCILIFLQVNWASLFVGCFGFETITHVPRIRQGTCT